VEREASAEFEEKRSVFIGHAMPIKSAEEAAEFIKAKKREFSDATHNVYAYILEGGRIAKYSDDGEPQGTAGMPVLDTIRKSGVDDACVVVTRYFGGILLGAGGLVRAYANGAKIALEAAGIITYEQYSIININCSYSDYQKIQPMLFKAQAVTDDTVFGESVTVVVAVKEEKSGALCEKIREATSGRSVAEITGKRFDYR